MWINLDDFMIPMDYSNHIGKSLTWINRLIKGERLPYILHNGRKLIPKEGKLPEYINDQSKIKDML